jgi:hypothetical protein
MLNLRKGDKVMVNTRKLPKPRVLTVTNQPEKFSGSETIYVYVSSGNVRPGHRSGGALIYTPEKVLDNGRVIPESLVYQATIQQPVQTVTDLKKVSEAQAQRYLMATEDMSKQASQVGKTIIEQMGGRRLAMMLGVKKFTLLSNGVAFAWPNRQRSKGNYVEITLTPMDEYDMEFFNWTPAGGKKPVKKYRGLHAEDLIPTFEHQTGWFVRMASQIADHNVKQAGRHTDIATGARAASITTFLNKEETEFAVVPSGLDAWLWGETTNHKDIAWATMMLKKLQNDCEKAIKTLHSPKYKALLNADINRAKAQKVASPSLVQKIEREVAKYARGEHVRVELVDPEWGVQGGFWVFTTELGMYRIWDKYTTGGKFQTAASKGWSRTESTWYVKV